MCTSIIEKIEIFNERLGAYWKFRLKLGGGSTYLWGGRFLDSSVGALLKLPQQWDKNQKNRSCIKELCKHMKIEKSGMENKIILLY